MNMSKKHLRAPRASCNIAIAKKWKQPVSTNWQVKKCIIVEIYIIQPEKKKGILSLAAVWMDLEMIILNEVHQAQKA
jgi:hypothetical protein